MFLNSYNAIKINGLKKKKNDWNITATLTAFQSIFSILGLLLTLFQNSDSDFYQKS